MNEKIFYAGAWRTPEQIERKRAANTRDRLKNPQRHRDYARKNKAAKRAWLTDYKASKGCRDCGEADPIVLDFHHVGKKHHLLQEKRNWRPSLAELGWVKMKEEVLMCVILCANCHRRETARLRKVG